MQQLSVSVGGMNLCMTGLYNMTPRGHMRHERDAELHVLCGKPTSMFSLSSLTKMAAFTHHHTPTYSIDEIAVLSDPRCNNCKID